MRILIIRTSAMGDIVHCLPVLIALRKALPEARIAWVVERTFAPLLAGHPDIDELIPVRTRQWRKQIFAAPVRREIAEARRAMRRFAPDVALELMGNHKGGLIARFSGARRIIGAARPFRREGSSAVWINQPVEAPGVHAVDKALAILNGLGLETEPVTPDSAASEPVDSNAVDPNAVDSNAVDFGPDKLLAEAPADAVELLEGHPPFVTIQAGAGWANKTYPAAWWGEVAQILAERAGTPTLVPIAPGEEHLAEAVVAASAGTARAVDAGPFPFLAALLRASALVLGGDTGPIHLAHALGTPVLCIIGPTDPERNGPYGAPELSLWHRLPCSCCYKRYAEPKACLLNITPDEVARRALDLLERTMPPLATLAKPRDI